MRLAEDRELRDRFRRGDQQAMAEVFQHYQAPITRYLAGGFTVKSDGGPVRWPGVTQRAELHDLLAETFRRALEERARLAYHGQSPYEAYLKAIARNLVIDRLRLERRQLEDLGRGGDAGDAVDAVHAGASSEREYQKAELRQLLAEFRAALDDDEQALLTLRFEEGLGQEPVAARLGRTRRWVRDTELALRKRLFRRLRGTGYLPDPAGPASEAP
jgi:RNA polymerase sigma factor (sigma-70 family)